MGGSQEGTLGKRVIDVVLGTILSIVALPVICVAALVSAVILRSWPFFVQDRVGRHGRRFRMPKLRTLPRSAPTMADKYDIANLEVPRFCRLLRAAHLDELPQLLLVPFGLMSLVGPRPEMPRLHANGDSDFARVRVGVRPGCTGLWQVSADAGRLIWEAPQYDLFYLQHASLRLDLWILWRTLRSLTGTGSLATLDHLPGWVTPLPTPPVASVQSLQGIRAGAGVAEVSRTISTAEADDVLVVLPSGH
jgi:lipopolysaccharide/colanic/teichoic acid biosynthesis glycosyltransferase